MPLNDIQRMYIDEYSKEGKWKTSRELSIELNIPYGTVAYYRTSEGLTVLNKLTEEMKKRIRECSKKENWVSGRLLAKELGFGIGTIGKFRFNNKCCYKDLNIKKECKVCGKIFIKKMPRQKFCTRECGFSFAAKEGHKKYRNKRERGDYGEYKLHIWTNKELNILIEEYLFKGKYINEIAKKLNMDYLMVGNKLNFLGLRKIYSKYIKNSSYARNWSKYLKNRKDV